ncbi:hypothetical protein E2C01_038995 [Portunus trituberculatus]|uniref:Uncharacterized protein n=1 Tax=Portunus trituberculatus TaxID=210409 RepID=A0A5B7FCF4_PORTR|nr:hypothetical protein [Portunus trituberculatus]
MPCPLSRSLVPETQTLVTCKTDLATAADPPNPTLLVWRWQRAVQNSPVPFRLIQCLNSI